MNTYHKQVSFDVTIQYDESSDGYFNALYLDECMRSSAVSATTAYTVEDLGTSTGTSIHNHNKPDTVYQHMVEDYTQSSFKLANRQPYIHYCRRCVCSECISKIEQKDCFIKLEAVEQKSAFIASEFGKDEYSFELFKSWVSRRFPFQFREGNFPSGTDAVTSSARDMLKASPLWGRQSPVAVCDHGKTSRCRGDGGWHADTDKCRIRRVLGRLRNLTS